MHLRTKVRVMSLSEVMLDEHGHSQRCRLLCPGSPHNIFSSDAKWFLIVETNTSQNLGSIGTESASRQSSSSKPGQGKGRQNQTKKATASNRASYSLNSKPIAYLVVQQAKQAKEAKQVKQAKPEPHKRKMNPT